MQDKNAHIFVSGSSGGLGLLAGGKLLKQGHRVIFHARNAARADELRADVAGVADIVVGDIGTVCGALDVADQVNALGRCDAVIHNAGVGYGEGPRLTADEVPEIFGVNVLAPYILTARIDGPTRLVYLSSSMHRTAPDLDDMLWRRRRWLSSTAYSESKFYVTALAFAVARLWPEVRSNAVDPGWVPTRMGGQGAPDDLDEGAATQVALASGDDPMLSKLSGHYLHHRTMREPESNTRSRDIQEQLLALCRDISGVSI